MSNKVFLTPGPSQLYPGVSSFIEDALSSDVCSISHRSGQYVAIHKAAVDNLKTLIGLPDNYSVFFLGSASESWERIFANFVDKKSFHFVNGSFSKKFYQYGTEFGYDTAKLEMPAGQGFNTSEANIPSDVDLITVTQNETSTGVHVPLEDIYALKEKFPKALLAIDVVSSLPNPNIDWEKVDTAFFSVQKCFGMPAGLGVWLVKDTCIAKAKELQAAGKIVGPHHNVFDLGKSAEKSQTPSTPNVLGIYLLSRVAQAMNEKGVEVIRQETQEKIALVDTLVQASSVFDYAVANTAHRSETVLVLTTTKTPAEINAYLAPHDLMVGGGYGDAKATQIRIANFPAISVAAMKKTVDLLKEI